MHLSEFRQQIAAQAEPPATLSDSLRVLWYAQRDNWTAAHDIAQNMPDPAGAWLHAYLHRWEGDDWNANYWYRRAGRTMPTHDLTAEWEELARHFLAH